MKVVRGDIWALARERHSCAVVVPTNCGWTRSGANPMGRGVAQQAAALAGPELARWYGAYCRSHGAATPAVLWRGAPSRGTGCPDLVLLPTKALTPEMPQLSWRGKSSLPLIERGLAQLSVMFNGLDTEVLVPLLGCGSGGLAEEDVLPLMHRWLLSDRFMLVLR